MAEIDPELKQLADEIKMRFADSRRAKVMQATANKWLLNKIGSGVKRDPKPDDLLYGRRGVAEPVIGQMFCYYYDPKTKADLPYYDMFPVVLMMKVTDKGFAGLNFHYLPPYIRARLLGFIRGTMRSTKLTREAKAQLTWNMIKSFSRFKIAAPAYKNYLADHVRSKMVRVHPQEWHHVVMLSVEQFVKASKEKVWADSLAAIRKSK